MPRGIGNLVQLDVFLVEFETGRWNVEVRGEFNLKVDSVETLSPPKAWRRRVGIRASPFIMHLPVSLNEIEHCILPSSHYLQPLLNLNLVFRGVELLNCFKIVGQE